MEKPFDSGNLRLEPAVKEDGKKRVRKDILKSIEEFERLREKTGFEGNLFEFITAVFRQTRELVRKKGFIEVLAEEHGINEEILMEFIEEFLDSVEWKTERDLRLFLRDFRKGLWIRISPRILSELRRENLKEFEEVKRSGFTEEEAQMILLNALLEKVPLSLKLWKEIEEDASGNGTRGWVEDRLAERKGTEGVELVPVNRTLYRKLQEEVKILLESQREALKVKLLKRLNDAVEKTYREAREMNRRKKRKLL